MGEISTEDAIVFLQNIDELMLREFPKRHLIEFHPCDACNLRCNGCTYSPDVRLKPEKGSFPFQHLSKICSLIQPDAITIAGGGEPALYKSGKYRLGDLICALGSGELECSPAIGLITNGTVWPRGNQDWHNYTDWVRYSLDSSSKQSYIEGKGRDCFDKVAGNIIKALSETDIPQVGVGFVYHPGNIAGAGNIISYFAKIIKQICPDELHRFNIQFRPWRPPTGAPGITEQIISSKDVDMASRILFDNIDQDKSLERFIKENTNIAVNLLCRGAREIVYPFSECYFGLAKTVIRADGSLYPCFRKAAGKDLQFYYGNIITDNYQKIALRELYVLASSARKICAFDHDKCLLCLFNNILEKAIVDGTRPAPDAVGDYFF